MDKTFDDISSHNRDVLIQNQEEVYCDAGRRAEVIVQAISDLRKLYGSS